MCFSNVLILQVDALYFAQPSHVPVMLYVTIIPALTAKRKGIIIVWFFAHAVPKRRTIRVCALACAFNAARNARQRGNRTPQFFILKARRFLNYLASTNQNGLFLSLYVNYTTIGFIFLVFYQTNQWISQIFRWFLPRLEKLKNRHKKRRDPSLLQ